MWAALCVEAGLFASSQLGSMASFTVLPFDPRRISGQAGEIFLILAGLTLWR